VSLRTCNLVRKLTSDQHVANMCEVVWFHTRAPRPVHAVGLYSFRRRRQLEADYFNSLYVCLHNMSNSDHYFNVNKITGTRCAARRQVRPNLTFRWLLLNVYYLIPVEQRVTFKHSTRWRLILGETVSHLLELQQMSAFIHSRYHVAKTIYLC